MKCLVTGGAGFIGSNLVHELARQGHKVDIVDNLTSGFLENLEGINRRHVFGDLLNLYEASYESERPDDLTLFIEDSFDSPGILNRVQQNMYDVIFHLAANPRVPYSIENPWITTSDNVADTIALCQAIIRGGSKTRLVFSSTCAAYGNTDVLPVHESTAKRPLSPYGWQKGAVEDFLSLASSLYGLDSISLRYFNVYGPRQPGNSAYSTAIASWCDKISSGAALRFDGDGTQTRDMIYVMDVVNANILAAKSELNLAGAVVNVGTGRETSNNQILEIFKKKFSEVNISYAPKRVGDIDRVYADVQRAKDVLGFESKTDLETGLNATFRWWKLIGD